MDIVEKLKELTNFDFECDSAETECEHSALRSLLTQFIENETRSCSMDFGGITPEYVYRMLGCQYSIDEIQDALSLCLKEYYER